MRRGVGKGHQKRKQGRKERNNGLEKEKSYEQENIKEENCRTYEKKRGKDNARETIIMKNRKKQNKN